MLFHGPSTGLDMVSINCVDFEYSVINKANIPLMSNAILSTSLEKYKPKTVYNLSSTIFTNQQYRTHSGTRQPILGTMNINYWMFNLLEIHGLVYVKYISIIYIIYLLKYYQHYLIHFFKENQKKIGVLYKL